MRRRVVITGMGCVTPLGVELPDVWNALVSGVSGVAPIALFDASDFPVRIAAEVKNWDMSAVGEDPAVWSRYPRQTRFAVASAIQAERHAGLDQSPVEAIRKGICLGCGEVFPDFLELARVVQQSLDGASLELGRFLDEARRAAAPELEFAYEPGLAVGLIAGLLDAQGPAANFTAACVSSSQAIGEAAETIRRGEADVMLAGGAHSMIHPLGITGFHRLSTLASRNDEPQRAARPFDRDRDGFVVGEGGVVLVLESLESARQRGATILAELTGYGSSHDAYRITDLEPHGRSAARCIQNALADASFQPRDIGYINAHGSGTVVNDKVETLAVKKAFGPVAYEVPMSSTKSMTGHLTTACGALELMATVMVLREGVAPPTINLETPDPDCDLDYVPLVARPITCRHAMSNSFGFGGQNVSLVVSSFES